METHFISEAGSKSKFSVRFCVVLIIINNLHCEKFWIYCILQWWWWWWWWWCDDDNIINNNNNIFSTFYGLDSHGIESMWGWDFLHPSIPNRSPPSLLYNGQCVSCPGVKPLRRDTDHSHKVPRLEKEYSTTCTPPMGFNGRLQV
jgi:hypothetical protein